MFVTDKKFQTFSFVFYGFTYCYTECDQKSVLAPLCWIQPKRRLFWCSFYCAFPSLVLEHIQDFALREALRLVWLFFASHSLTLCVCGRELNKHPYQLSSRRQATTEKRGNQRFTYQVFQRQICETMCRGITYASKFRIHQAHHATHRSMFKLHNQHCSSYKTLWR